MSDAGTRITSLHVPSDAKPRKDVQTIQATERAFAALLPDGHVVTWGDAVSGGDSGPVTRFSTTKRVGTIELLEFLLNVVVFLEFFYWFV